MAKHRRMAANVQAPAIATHKPPETFKADYEFKKVQSARSPLRNQWEEKYFRETGEHGQFLPFHDPKEVALVTGRAFRFSGTRPAGKLRVSGNKGAHQIGKRS